MLPPASYTIAPCDLDLVAAIRAELDCTETLAWVLARRGVSVDQARALVTDDPSAEAAQLHDPLLLGEMAAAVERIRYAIEQGESIVVHGDYDADGICSTTLLVEGLESLGADVQAFLPDRFATGYGLHMDSVERFARDGARLLITVDCGITAIEPIAQANDLGMDVIVCDHHLPGPVLPDAIIASTNPSDYPFPELCATAVAGKLVQALGVPSSASQHELEAIATVADCMPLVEENRVLVQRGLRALRATKRPGLLALIEQCGLRPADIDAEAIAFKIAPRINAVGRISASERGYELLRADASQAKVLAMQVDETNEERRAIERDISDQAIAQVESWTPEQRASHIYVVHGRGWNEGVVGIVASRLVERYWRPVLVIADGEPARGSGRSIDGVDLHAALASADDLLLRWGGHAAAGGVTVDPSRIDDLRTRLTAWGAANIAPGDLAPRDRIDAIVPAHDLRFELVQELERIAPFGTGWQRPRLLAIDAQVEDCKPVGGDQTHLKCTIRVGDVRVPAIGFGMASCIPGVAGGVRVDVALRPSINRFRGIESLQAELDRIYDIAPEAPDLAGWTDAAPTPAMLESLVDMATGLLPSEFEGADAERPPAIEALLARPDTVDLRHRNAGDAHIAQLLAADATVVVVVADVHRRRERLAVLALPSRFNVATGVLISERQTKTARERILRTVAEAPTSRLVITDHGSFAQLMEEGAAIAADAIVVLDPPMLARHRDLLAAAPAPLHLVFGASEARFAADVLRAVLDVRGTFASTWRLLRDEGPKTASQLAKSAVGAELGRHAPSALVHAIRSLVDRGHITLDAERRFAATQAARSAASATH
ncbi:MAG: single-stranded-DNA-specific exonuclease RecJ [Thermoleophilia bacterium]|nr:single-stranded-DNA-specific exonuclease RecJ [Thermoleophilia bacterium]